MYKRVQTGTTRVKLYNFLFKVRVFHGHGHSFSHFAFFRGLEGWDAATAIYWGRPPRYAAVVYTIILQSGTSYEAAANCQYVLVSGITLTGITEKK